MFCKEILLTVTTLWHSVLKKLLKKRKIAFFKANNVDSRHEEQPESTWDTKRRYYRSLRPVFTTFLTKKKDFQQLRCLEKNRSFPAKSAFIIVDKVHKYCSFYLY